MHLSILWNCICFSKKNNYWYWCVWEKSFNMNEYIKTNDMSTKSSFGFSKLNWKDEVDICVLYLCCTTGKTIKLRFEKIFQWTIILFMHEYKLKHHNHFQSFEFGFFLYFYTSFNACNSLISFVSLARNVCSKCAWYSRSV